MLAWSPGERAIANNAMWSRAVSVLDFGGAGSQCAGLMLLLSLLTAQMVFRRDCSSAIEEWTREVLTLSGYDQSLFLPGEVAQVIRHNAYP